LDTSVDGTYLMPEIEQIDAKRPLIVDSSENATIAKVISVGA
jgi:hypothetical protein